MIGPTDPGEYLEPLDLNVVWGTRAAPLHVAGDQYACLIVYARHRNARSTDLCVAAIQFEECAGTTFGGPNAASLHGHRV